MTVGWIPNNGHCYGQELNEAAVTVRKGVPSIVPNTEYFVCPVQLANRGWLESLHMGIPCNSN